MWRPGIRTRVALDCLALICALFAPWWTVLVLVLLIGLCWRSWEVPFVGLLMDFLWLPPGTAPLFLIGSIAYVWLMEPVRAMFLAR